jgi:hypothetical protein
MESKSLKRFTIVAVVLAILSMTMTSCNRGYGCPYEMKSAVKIVLPIIKK